MDRKVFRRLIALILTGGILLSSSGVYAALSYDDETTEALTSGVSEVSDDNETTKTDELNTTETSPETTTSKDYEITTKNETTTKVHEFNTSHDDKPMTDNKAVSWVGAGISGVIGSETNPYAVSDAEHLLAMSAIINDEGNADKYFKLTADIDMSSVEIADIITASEEGLTTSIVSVDPTVDSENVFFVLDGDGRSIMNLDVATGNLSSLSIFGYINSKSELNDVKFDNITLTNSFSNAAATGIILKNDGSVSDCRFTNIDVTMSASNNTDEYFNPVSNSSFKIFSGVTAGIVDNNGSFEMSTYYENYTDTPFINNIKVKSSGTRTYVGAIVAQNRGYINKFRAASINITCSSGCNFVGGMIGANFTSATSSRTGIYYVNAVISKISGGNNLGGLVGSNTGKIQYCSITGSIKSSGKTSASNYNILSYGGKTAGGIVGTNTGDIQKCAAINVGVYFNDSVDGGIYGGIAGTSNFVIKNSVATGSTGGAGTDVERYVGGIVGVGSSESKFVLEDCYTLVKILSSSETLGAVVGKSGDTAMKNNKVRNCYYSSIVSSRPSPVSYGGTGEMYGDLQYSKPYGNAVSTLSPNLECQSSDFTFSGWGSSSFSVVGNYSLDTSSTTNGTLNSSSTGFTYGITETNKSDKIYYEVNITLPNNIGNTTSAITLSREPMVFRTINTSAKLSGVGTYASPYVLTTAVQLQIATYVPYAHYKFGLVSDSATISIGQWPSAVTFWGSIDFNNKILNYQNSWSMFKEIYGSRDDSMVQNNATTHISDSSDSADTSANLAYGVVKNLKLVIPSDSSYFEKCNFLGNVCNATIKNISVSSENILNNIVMTSADSGVLIKGVYSNSYIYGCYMNANVSTNYSNVGGLIGYINADNAIIDNCGSSAVLTVELNNATNCAGFVGRIISLNGGVIQNCYASGGVKPKTTSISITDDNYVFAASSVSSASLYNCLYTPSDYYSSGKGVYKGIPDGSYTGSCKLWSFFETDTNSGQKNDVSMLILGGNSGSATVRAIENYDKFDWTTYQSSSLDLPTYFDAHFSASDTYFSTGTLSVTSGGIGIPVSASDGHPDNATLYIKHNATGLVAKVGILTSSDLAMDNGYYLIYKATDLYIISKDQGTLDTVTHQQDKYVGATNKFMLMADIDMTGFSIDPIGKTSGLAFRGDFVSDPNSAPHKITNLTISSSNPGKGLFGYVDGATISNVSIDSCNITGGSYTGGLVGQVINGATISGCTVNNCNVVGTSGIGGLIGGVYSGLGTEVKTTVSNCSVTDTNISSNITATNTSIDYAFVGGIIGRVGSLGITSETKYAEINGCTVEGCELSAVKNGIGGIAGIAPYALNVISSCNVVDTNLKSNGTTSATYGSIGGIVGAFGGDKIENCNLTGSTVKGDYAAGIVTRLINISNTSTISGCVVTSSTIESSNIAAGILSQISNYVSNAPLGTKIITACKIADSTTVKALVSGGIVGNIQSFSTATLTIDKCTNLGTIESTGLKGSVVDGAGGIVGRFSTNFNTDGITINNCVASGIVKGSSILGGVIGILRSNTHSSAPIVNNCYITSTFTAKNLAAVKGRIIGYILTQTNKDNLTGIVNNAVFSSFNSAISPYGNAVDNSTAGSRSYYDMNLGADQESGLTVSGYNATYSGNIEAGEGTNSISLQYNENAYLFVCKTANYPSVSSATFVCPNTNSTSTFSTESTKITLTTGMNNSLARCRINIQSYKGKAKVSTNYTGEVNGEIIEFKVGFTLIISGVHKFDGTGTQANPYKIYDVEDLIAINEHHDAPLAGENGDSFYASTTYYTIMNDIDCTESCSENENTSFPSIGTADAPFGANISSDAGGPYTISNLYIDSNGDLAGKTLTTYGYSDAYGLFGYTDGATINNINFENAVIKSTVSSIQKNGMVSGIVVGNAVNTSISNITVSGTTSIDVASSGISGGSVGGIVGVAGNGVVLTDVSVIGEADGRISISALSSVGGIVGTGSAATGSSITNAKVQYVDVTSTAVSGTAYAGGIAATYSGNMYGTYETSYKLDSNGEQIINPQTGLPETQTTLITPCTVDASTVTGIIAGGAVGAGTINSGNNNYGLYVKGIRVSDTDILSTATSTNGIAGGILGSTFESYNYSFDDCIIDSASTVSALYVTGGIVGRAQNNGGMYPTSLYIENSSATASLTQRAANITGASTLKSAGIGGVIGLISNSANLMNATTFEPLMRIENCTGGGVLKGDSNVGGIIGQLASIQTNLYLETDSFIENCIITAKFDAIYDATTRFGVVVGSIEGNAVTTDAYKNPSQTTPYPDTDRQGREYEYVCSPFDNIFYSSYMSSEYELFGLSEIYNYQYNDFTTTIYDINQVNYGYDADGEIIPIGVGIVPIFTSGEGVVTYGSQDFGTSEYFFSEDFKNDNHLTDDDTLLGFNLNNTDFVLQSVTSSDTSVFEVIANPDTANAGVRPYRIVTHAFDTADLIFTYDNGLQIAIPIVCGVNFDGSGSSDDPILVSNEDIFFFLVKALPGYYFRQTTDLDFTGKGSRYSITSGNQLVNTFRGVYDGDGHTITGLNASFDVSDNAAGYFGTVQGIKTDTDDNVIPNIKDLTFINCSINSGDTTAGTGIVAGKLAEGASISNVNVMGGTVTSSESSSLGLVGGAIGTVAGACKIDGMTVSGTTVSTASGSAGGAIGTVTTSSAIINNVVVDSVNVSSGSISAGTFMGGATSADIAGGIVAQAVGTINGVQTTDEDGNAVLSNSVNNCNVSAYISGGAVGAVYVPNGAAAEAGNLHLNNIKVSSVNVNAKYNANFANQTAGSGLLGVIKGTTELQLNNCYVDKHCTVESMKYASGVIATNESAYFTSLDITDVETYAKVTAAQNLGSQTIYAGGMYAYLSGAVNPNIIKMDGCVAGGSITASGWTSYCGGVFGAMDSENVIEAITNEFFVNGVLSASIYNKNGETDTIHNAGTASYSYYGKVIAGFKDGVFVDDDDFSTVVFHDNFYSSYPQNYHFFGMNSVDNFQSITAEVTPFENINVGSNFLVSNDLTSWNAIAITRNLDSAHQLYAKFDKSELSYGNGKISKIDAEGFSVNSSDPDEECCVSLDGDVTMTEDAGIGTYYSFVVIPNAYGAALIGASYECGLATTVPILCVDINGDGSQANPFQISNAVQLRVVSYLTGSYYYYNQTADIDLSNTYNRNSTETEEIINYNGGMGYAPIGTLSSPFKGNYNGQGYKITGLYINRETSDYVGLFGYVQSNGVNTTVIRNVHVELMDTDGGTEKSNGVLGKNYVGGLIGKAELARVENCSVAVGVVTGQNDVGALIGTSDQTMIKQCFTQSDANAFGPGSNVCAGGIVGSVNQGVNSNNSEITSCFATGSVYAPAITRLGDSGYAGGIVGYIRNGSLININNCMFTGTTASGHGIYSDMSATSHDNTISSCVDAGQNTAMINNAFAKIASAVAGGATSTTFTNVYYDSSLLKVDAMQTNRGTAKKTSELASGNAIEGLSDSKWNYQTNFYPVPITATIDVVNYDSNGNVTGTETKADAYSQAYSKISSVPVLTSENEEANIETDIGYGKGLVYPVQLVSSFGESKISYSSSVLDKSDTTAYPEGYDNNLYGNVTKTTEPDGEGGTKEVTNNNKNVDLLFEDKEGSAYTSVYRNVFNTTINNVLATEETSISNNTRVVTNGSKGNVFANGEAYYNLQVPVVYGKMTVDGITVNREFKIPLSYGTTYCVATERQLFALGSADNEIADPTSKFASYYNYSYDYKLITDITIQEDNTTNFKPIGNDNAQYGYIGQFDGSGHTITNLRISSASDYVGMFSKVSNDYTINTTSSQYAYVKNLNLVDATVNGQNYVGSLIGLVKGENVTVSGCSITGGTVEGTGSYIGGLIGAVEYRTDTISSCNASNKVTGTANSIGGLIGQSSGTITSCYATGEVFSDKLTQTSGVGGLIGYMANGTVSDSFASGNVEVETFNRLTGATTYGVGGFVGIVGSAAGGTNGAKAIERCFSGGNVSCGTGSVIPSVATTANNTGTVGIGGFSGVNYVEIINCYSSAAVVANFETIKNQSDLATYGVGVGGVCGVARGNVQNVYSSGSVASPDVTNLDSERGAGCYYGVGGTIGTTMNSSATFSNCYFDKWTNTDADMTSIGDKADNSVNGVASYTTTDLTSGTALTGWDAPVWGFSAGAYPYLKGILNENVAPVIRVNAILSVVSVEPDEDDLSARSGKGITMALTVPTTFKYISYINNEETNDYESTEVTYSLKWSGATLTETGGVTKAAITRTQNIAEYIDLDAVVDGYEEYGARTYRRLCADMRGTYSQPYLVGSVNDLEHVNMTLGEVTTAKSHYTGFYDQWGTPLNDQNQQVEGTVYYQLMSDIDASESARTFTDLSGTVYTYSVTNLVYDPETGEAVYVELPDGTTVQQTETVEKTFDYNGFVLNGNSYAIKNITGDSPYFANVDSNSKIINIIFDQFKFNSDSDIALVNNMNGGLYDVYITGSLTSENGGSKMAGLAITNSGTIDGCVADMEFTEVKDNMGVIAVTNNGTINNTGAAGSVGTVDEGTITNIGGFVANNNSNITNSFSTADISVNAVANSAVTNIGGFAGQNKGTISSSYSRSGIDFAETPASTDTVAAFVGKVTNSNECITDCYVAGTLGYFNNSQHSIALGNVAGAGTFNSLYVDKAIAGGKSYKSLKYATPTENIIKLKNAAEGMLCEATVTEDVTTYAENGSFIINSETEDTYPQIASIVKATDTVIKDENNEAVVYPEGTIIRSYEVLKAYSNVSVAAVITANSQYIDCLALNSNSNSINSTVSKNVKWKTLSDSVSVINVNNVSSILSTTETAGEEVLVASSSEITLNRNMKITPKIYLRVKTGPNNPNFSLGGYGTQAKPYKINDADSLQALSYYGANSNLFFVISNDINMNGYAFKQIPVFSAKLNKDVSSKYTISNLSSDGGLFGIVDETAEVYNVGLNGVNVTSSDVYTGGFADEIRGATVANCFVIGKVKSTSEDAAASTGGFAGCVSNTASISGIVTTGEVIGNSAVGGVFGYIDTAAASELVSTAKVTGLSESTKAGGIAGIAQNQASLTNSVFGGTCSDEAIVGEVLTDAVITSAYYDSQLNVDSYDYGTAKTTTKATVVFKDKTDKFVTDVSADMYPIPAGLSDTNNSYTSFETALKFALETLKFYKGSSKGNIGYYTSLLFDDSVSYNSTKTAINVIETDSEGYLAITDSNNSYTVKVDRFVEGADPALKLTLGSNANVYRIINPGLVKTANISYTIKNESGDSLSGNALGVLIRSLGGEGGTNVDAINSFVDGTVNGETTSTKSLDGLLISSTVNGFYIGDMLPDGYEYSVKAYLNGNELSGDNVKLVEGQYGTFVNLNINDGTDSCNVVLKLSVVKSDDILWGIRVRDNTLWN